MKIYLARHGNTFGPKDRVVFVGRDQDLPLVEEGRRQAFALADFFEKRNISFSQIFCAELMRTKQFAQIIADSSEISSFPAVAPELNEISYGLWGGKSSDEIAALGFEKELEAWRSSGTWPKGVFPENEVEVRTRVLNFLSQCTENEQPNQNYLVVSSNGILRYFLTAIPGAFEQLQAEQKLTMKTGSVSLIEIVESKPHLIFWNILPSDVAQV